MSSTLDIILIVVSVAATVLPFFTLVKASQEKAATMRLRLMDRNGKKFVVSAKNVKEADLNYLRTIARRVQSRPDVHAAE